MDQRVAVSLGERHAGGRGYHQERLVGTDLVQGSGPYTSGFMTMPGPPP